MLFFLILSVFIFYIAKFKFYIFMLKNKVKKDLLIM